MLPLPNFAAKSGAVEEGAKVIKSEQETIFRWATDEEEVSVWTAQSPVKRKLEKAGYRPYRMSTRQGVEVGWFFKLPLSEFRWRVTGGKKGRSLTPEQRQAAGDRFRKARLAVR